MLRITNFPASIQRLSQSVDLNLLCPAGIGDLAWILGKFHRFAIEKKGQGRTVKFWMPFEEQQRAGQYLELLGLDYGYLPGLSTQWVWKQSGAPALANAGCYAIQANRHLENGNRIESWYADRELFYPRLPALEDDASREPFVLLFPGSRNYMMGNLAVRNWAEIAIKLHREIGRVRLVGAGADAEFVGAIANRVGGANHGAHLLDRPLREVLAAAQSPLCRGFVGVASGLLIVSTIQGLPCYFLYPQHLGKMPGSWEPPGSRSAWSYVRDGIAAVKTGQVTDFLLNANHVSDDVALNMGERIGRHLPSTVPHTLLHVSEDIQPKAIVAGCPSGRTLASGAVLAP